MAMTVLRGWRWEALPPTPTDCPPSLTAVVRRPFVSAPGADSGTDHGGMHYVATSRTHFARIARMSEETVKSTDRLREPEVRNAWSRRFRGAGSRQRRGEGSACSDGCGSVSGSKAR